MEKQRLGSNLLAWDPNVEKDIAGYRLLRMREGSSSEEIVAALEPGATTAEDREIGAGERLSYAVVAFDRDGLESEPSDPIEVESVDYGLSAAARDGAIHLHWNPEVQEGFAAARVLREGTFGDDEIGRVPSEGFVDREVKPRPPLPVPGDPGPRGRLRGTALRRSWRPPCRSSRRTGRLAILAALRAASLRDPVRKAG